jgi:putative membrane protein
METKMAYSADPRVLFAAERTLLAWQRSAIALMGFGFVVERFGLFLQMETHQPVLGVQRNFSLLLGVAMLVLGAAVALVSARQFRQVVKNLDPSVVPPGYWTHAGIALNLVVAVVALALVAHIVWPSS